MLIYQSENVVIKLPRKNYLKFFSIGVISMGSNIIYAVESAGDASLKKPMQIIKSAKGIQISYASYLIDEAKVTDGYADELIFPEDEKQIVEFVKRADKENKSITISGARTGIVAGAVPYSGSLLSTEKMKRVIGIEKDPQEERWYLKVQPGVTLQEVNHIIKDKKDINLEIPGWLSFQKEERKFFYPPDPTEDTASIGGTVATNASGARSYKYGARN